MDFLEYVFGDGGGLGELFIIDVKGGEDVKVEGERGSCIW